jgi:hypothetical protein
VTDLFPAAPQPDYSAGAPAVAVGRRPAPRTVRVATWILFTLVALMVVSIVGTIWDMATYGGYVDRAAAGVHATANQVATEKSDNTVGDVVFLVLLVVFGLLFGLSGLLARRGLRTGQVLAFVAIAPLVLCWIGPFLPADSTKLSDAAGNLTPAAIGVVAGICVLLPLPLGIVTVILLLTSSARAFFRRTPPAPTGYMYVPAAWGYAPPGYGAPGYPVPGQPGYGAGGYGVPGYGAPGYGAPGYGAPGYGAPGQPWIFPGPAVPPAQPPVGPPPSIAFPTVPPAEPLPPTQALPTEPLPSEPMRSEPQDGPPLS